MAPRHEFEIALSWADPAAISHGAALHHHGLTSFFGVEKVWIGEGRVSITEVERTRLEGLSRPQCCGDFAEVLHAFARRRQALDLDRIIAYAVRLDAATCKRLGWVLEHQGVDPSRRARWQAVPTQGYRKLDPTGPRRGPCHARWQVLENLPGQRQRRSPCAPACRKPARAWQCRGRGSSGTTCCPGSWPACVR